jgi:hypothetical protein
LYRLFFNSPLEEIAAITPGFSGAELKNLVNEAALLAARREQNEVRYKDVLDALEKIVLGPERPILLSRAAGSAPPTMRADTPSWASWCPAPIRCTG